MLDLSVADVTEIWHMQYTKWRYFTVIHWRSSLWRWQL